MGAALVWPILSCRSATDHGGAKDAPNHEAAGMGLLRARLVALVPQSSALHLGV